jgi:hypothetical protein
MSSWKQGLPLDFGHFPDVWAGKEVGDEPCAEPVCECEWGMQIEAAGSLHTSALLALRL